MKTKMNTSEASHQSEAKMSTRTVPMPDIPILESEEMWSQRAIDTPEAVLEELKQLKEQLDVNQPTTATALPKSDE
jgi:hypothetical protein